MKKQKEKKENLELLYRFFAQLDDPDKIAAVLEDLCTYNEVEQMAGRLRCALLLMEGKTYKDVLQDVDLSSATVSRVSRCIQHGSGGYSEILKEWSEKTKK